MSRSQNFFRFPFPNAKMSSFSIHPSFQGSLYAIKGIKFCLARNSVKLCGRKYDDQFITVPVFTFTTKENHGKILVGELRETGDRVLRELRPCCNRKTEEGVRSL